MRLVYAHFPINANAEKSGSELSIRNFLGEKIVRTIPMCEGVKVTKDIDVKDQLLFEGNSIENVSRYASGQFMQVCRICLRPIYIEVPRPVTAAVDAGLVLSSISHAWSSIKISGNFLTVSTCKRRAQLMSRFPVISL